MKEITIKWPAILITGEKVTEEQAIDIIIRTDEAVVNPSVYTFGNNHDFGNIGLNQLVLTMILMIIN